MIISSASKRNTNQRLGQAHRYGLKDLDAQTLSISTNQLPCKATSASRLRLAHQSIEACMVSPISKSL
jgi:hypothetical protein